MVCHMPANISVGAPQVPRGTGPEVGVALDFVMTIETGAIGHCLCPTLAMAPPGVMHSVATVVRRVLAHLPALDPHPLRGSTDPLVLSTFGGRCARLIVHQRLAPPAIAWTGWCSYAIRRWTLKNGYSN